MSLFSHPSVLCAKGVVFFDGLLDGDNSGERLKVGAGDVLAEAPVRLGHQAHVPIDAESVGNTILEVFTVRLMFYLWQG